MSNTCLLTWHGPAYHRCVRWSWRIHLLPLTSHCRQIYGLLKHLVLYIFVSRNSCPDKPAGTPTPGPIHQEGDKDQEEEAADGNDAGQPLRQRMLRCNLSCNTNTEWTSALLTGVIWFNEINSLLVPVKKTSSFFFTTGIILFCKLIWTRWAAKINL